ncbi:MAG: hypothetical protein EAZ39_23475 [Oscillatoriales cyanobacterium]|nr:MAG: hypothetical protein EAZ88_03015 [Oscillatoriales cyanobacterium]TAG06376.1 MAG: hypothetical protein EAZ45_04890 [Oscillatoriales cyanobacterium]TAG14759.1 MAG: hypothetical protein EAZ39_23475 [Oscillatoriales cyanobacterium]TAG43133.1 MAG: hypothetical protein EAZ33_13515 [Oscillatoriales cyanobacterium]TAG55694.1 MAG: hypothetical protein EAZ28_21855 [Oscillatoriales cyanobacterium]
MGFLLKFTEELGLKSRRSRAAFKIFCGVADLRYERLNMPVIETTIDKAWGFLTYFFSYPD